MPLLGIEKHAKRKGIKANIKAEELISLILENAHSAEDSFVAMEQKIINSCKKVYITIVFIFPFKQGKQDKKFEEDKQTESDTPRRETYTLDCPSSDTIVNLDNDLIVSSASPMLKKTPATNDTSRNVTMSRGSERKSKKRKDRPKTPIPSRKSTGRKSSSIRGKISFAETPSEADCENNTSTKFSGKKEKRVSTPMPVSKTKRMN
ncbi:nucleolar and spindle-associated protein 1 [Trichonephila clavata]|uniref:Nucleolar and spindle-associated protein 1 n=1 Tax=Trichonephila clavata TaxID=2740835 RepID=A0A8X6KET9_TRICU|nr:nucleolar and spindle-associated protein 1 [Trichonephila clavata]